MQNIHIFRSNIIFKELSPQAGACRELNGGSKRCVHLEPVTVTLFRERVSVDVTRVSRRDHPGFGGPLIQ